MMPEISIDLTRLVVRALRGRYPTGVDRVCLSYARRYREARVVLYKAGMGRALLRADSRRLVDLLLADRSVDFVPKLCTLLVRALLRRSPPLTPGGIFFNIGHGGIERPAYVRWLRDNRLRPVFMVHDLIPMTHPEYCREGESQRHERRIAAMLGCGAGLIVNSVSTQRILQGYAKKQKLILPPLIVAHLGISLFPIGTNEPILKDPYFVMLGTIEPRKNHILMLQCWRRLGERWKDGAAVPKLVLIGQRGWDIEYVERFLHRSEVCRSLVSVRSDCDDTELAIWLRHARALLFPSFSEGYGLPLVEALAQGTPVIASDLDAFHENAGDIPDYLDPLDGLGWLQAITDFTKDDSERRTKQLARLSHFVPPTWADHFRIVENLIDGLAKEADHA
jgi:glycosyltransferase involved in cell wall biosynthesis